MVLHIVSNVVRHCKVDKFIFMFFTSLFMPILFWLWWNFKGLLHLPSWHWHGMWKKCWLQCQCHPMPLSCRCCWSWCCWGWWMMLMAFNLFLGFFQNLKFTSINLLSPNFFSAFFIWQTDFWVTNDQKPISKWSNFAGIWFHHPGHYHPSLKCNHVYSSLFDKYDPEYYIILLEKSIIS